RDARARLLADDISQLQTQLAAEAASEAALQAERDAAQQRLAKARQLIANDEAQAAAAAPEISAAAEVWYRLSALRERLRGTAALATERLRLLGAPEPAPRGSDPDELAATAARLLQEVTDLDLAAEQARQQTEQAAAQRLEAEQAAEQAERQLAEIYRRQADQREQQAIQAGRVAAARSTVQARQQEIDRLRERLAEATAAEEAARLEFTLLEGQIAGVEQGEQGLDAAHEAAVAALAVIDADYQRVCADRDDAQTAATSWSARLEALELSLTRQDGAGALLGSDQIPGLLGSLAAMVEVEAGWEAALATALGRAAGAVAVDSADIAVDAIRKLRLDQLGRATFMIAQTAPEPQPTPDIALPAGACWALSVVTLPKHLISGISQLLEQVVLVESLAQARSLIQQHPQLTVVSQAGDLLSNTWAEGGSQQGQSLIELQAAHDEAQTCLDKANQALERSRFELARLQAERETANQQVEHTLAQLHESDAQFSAVADRLGRLGGQTRSAQAEIERLTKTIAQADTALATATQQLTELADHLESGPVDEPEVAADPTERDRLVAAARQARQVETEARLAARTCEERARALRARLEATEKAADAERAARAEAALRAERRRAGARLASTVADATVRLDELVSQALVQATEHREQVDSEHALREQRLTKARQEAELAGAELARLTDAAHRDELALAAQKAQLEQFEQRCIEELGLSVADLLAEFGPDQLVPLLPASDTALADDAPPPAESVPYNRQEQAAKLRRAERALATLGKVNPLALEEYAALEERHRFLTDQLADIKKSAADVREVIREVDARVEQVFSAALKDTTAAFERVFPRLFPGGEGRIVATEPNDILTTGIDVEARPAGKSVKRLSLLSGGERSLVAVAFVIAIFLARPSPFYVLDEVEAALDETNLSRLLDIVGELRQNSQILIITHQKRTMEIADALYGVTMKDDGVTQVISQRLKDAA
ncbi:MAG: AAA family ATPase, partial [Bifidobacteriaceae bacterium]|nr:AAA family ATPase [Bifidobacteriaceae bacterium]